MHVFLIWLIALAAIALMLLRPWRVSEAVWICAGAALLVVTRLISGNAALHAVSKGTDVYLFLAGMMLLAELARHEGVFDWIAGHAVSRARGSSHRLFFLVYATGVGVTALLSNDATAVVLTPAILAAVRRARVAPAPFLLACALVANAASFVLPMSNPSNLIIFSHHMPALGQWLRIFLLPAIVSIAATYFCLRFLSRRELAAPADYPEVHAALTPAGRMAFAGLILAAVVLLVSSGLSINLGIPTCAAAVAALIMVSFRNRTIYKTALREISWSILPLVAGLFVLIESLDRAGLLQWLKEGLGWLTRQPRLAADIISAGAAALLSNLMNNLPVALAGGATLPVAPRLTHAVLLGVNIGPNLSVTGSLATILWLIALRRENVKMTRKDFLKAGLVVMPAALLLSVVALWIAT